jgi:hypothetical protein
VNIIFTLLTTQHIPEVLIAWHADAGPIVLPNLPDSFENLYLFVDFPVRLIQDQISYLFKNIPSKEFTQ